MIDLRPNCVAQFLMNDDADNPYVVGLNGVPTELIQNNYFKNDSNWIFGGNWSYNAGFDRADHDGYGDAALQPTPSIPVVVGKKYVIYFEIHSYTSGGVASVIGNQEGTVRSANGRYIEILTAINSDNLEFWAVTSFIGAVDNIFCFCLDDFPCTGVFNERTYYRSVAGKINKALSFDGAGDYIKVFDEGALEFPSNTQDFSIVFWVKRGRINTVECIMGKADGWSDGWFIYFNVVNNLTFKLNSKAVVSAAIADTNCHLIIITVDRDGNAQIFIDNGSPVSVDFSGETMGISRDFVIGRWPYTSSGFFQGDIDVTAFFDKALSSAERDMLWHGSKGTERLISLHHHIYCGQDGKIDYSSPAAEMALDDSQITIPGQALPANTIWHYIRRQIDDECALESDDSPVCIVAIDSNGDMIGDTPNPPSSLTIERLSNGRFRLRWRYTKLNEEITPTGFKIYMDSGSGFNFSSPDATIAYGPGGINNEFSWISGALTHGQIYRFCVRSYRTGKGESQNTDYVATDADSEGPAAITNLRVSYEEI